MPSKKKKYNARFPAGRIKKIMQSDEEIGKVAQAVPIIISRTLELFVESLLTKTIKITNSRNAKTLSTSHMKQCIMAENRFDFLRELVKNIPDISVAEEVYNDNDSSMEQTYDPDTPYDLSMPSTSSHSNAVATTPSSSNGGETSFFRNGGGGKIQARTAPTSSATVTSSIPSLSESSALPLDEESLAHMKRQMDIINRLRRNLETQDDSTTSSTMGFRAAVPSSVIRHTSVSSTSTPVSSNANEIHLSKLYRSDSAPTAIYLGVNKAKHHQLPEQQVPTNYSIQSSNIQGCDSRRLKHQPKSDPCSCSTSAVLPVSDQQQRIQKRHPPKQTVIPAPIVNIDFYNKPVVKIDYSNLPLHDNVIVGIAEDSNSKSNQSPNVDSSSSSSPSSSTSATASKSAFVFNPVINIDLSNIVTSPNPSATITIGTETKNPTPATSSTFCTTVSKNNNSFLELDEDYDNI